MIGVARAVGDAAREPRRALDQGDARVAVAQQLDRVERTRKAAADDRDMPAAHATVSGATSNGIGSARVRVSRMRAVSSRTISMTRCKRHFSSVMQLLHWR